MSLPRNEGDGTVCISVRHTEEKCKFSLVALRASRTHHRTPPSWHGSGLIDRINSGGNPAEGTDTVILISSKTPRSPPIALNSVQTTGATSHSGGSRRNVTSKVFPDGVGRSGEVLSVVFGFASDSRPITTISPGRAGGGISTACGMPPKAATARS